MKIGTLEEFSAKTLLRTRTSWILVFSIFSIALAISLRSHFGIHRALVNDEAVELVIGTGMPLDRFYFWSPQAAYAEGEADLMETGVPYVNRFLAHFTKENGQPGSFIPLVRVIFAIAQACAAALLGMAAARLWGMVWGLATGLMLGVSAFALIVNNVVTRNGVSLLWSTLAVYVLVRFFVVAPVKRWVPVLGLALVLVLGCWTYTSFRMLAAAIYFALVVDWLRFDRGWRALPMIGSSLVLFVVALLALLMADGGSFSSFAGRGSYVLGEASDYFRRLWPTLLSPGYYVRPEVATFLVEDVHILVGRQVLSLLLVPFFVVGLIGGWFQGARFVQFLSVVWGFGMAACALGGANMKYLFVFLPVTMMIAMSGLRLVSGTLAEEGRWGRWYRAGVAVLLVLVAFFELSDVFVRFPKAERSQMNVVSERMGDYAAAQVDSFSRVYIQPGLGFDIVMWRLRLLGDARVTAFSTLDLLRKAMEKTPPPPNSLLIIDYPAEVIPAEQGGWRLPSGVRIVNVRDTF